MEGNFKVRVDAWIGLDCVFGMNRSGEGSVSLLWMEDGMWDDVMNKLTDDGRMISTSIN